MPGKHNIPPVAFGEVYRQRLKKESIARRVVNALSLATARLPRFRIREPRRIALLCQWGVGDAVLLLPLLRALRRTFPDASIELIGKPWLGELFVDENCCDRTYVLVPPWTAYFRKYRQPMSIIIGYFNQLRHIRKESFDWLISARFDPREILQLRLLRATATFGFRAAGGRSWITDNFALSRSEHDSLHRTDLARTLARSLGAVSCDDDAYFLPHHEKQASSWLWLRSRGYVSGVVLAVHTGAGHPNRRWRQPHFDTVLSGLTEKPGMIIFIEDQGKPYTTWSGDLPHVHWEGGLADLKTVLSICDVFLGTDSGVMHLAAAAGCKVVAVFGAGEPTWFGPTGPGHTVVINDQIQCRPCFDQCIYASPICLDTVSDDAVLEALDLVLVKARKQPTPD
jgi:ADP-heptose:LPS heptosyltransferase